MTQFSHPLSKSARFVSKIAVQDSGDYNERGAPAGQIGIIDSVVGHPGAIQYSVVFWPSGIANFWEPHELDQDGEPLLPGDPRAPAPALFDVVNQVNQWFVSDFVDEGADLLCVPVEAAAAAAVALHGALDDGEVCPVLDRDEIAAAVEILTQAMAAAGSGREIQLSFETADLLAAAVGLADRLGGTDTVPEPEPLLSSPAL
ncbi:hypothetical protein V5F40_21835 [Xanthobacter sp. DSM 14520]|uniref:hypothetical protein n=1 Tax=Xanthobacter autotrophicus (strain ATCC BAA-1158 / Py2) TaxID=78245 RepID=UPI003729FC2D